MLYLWHDYTPQYMPPPGIAAELHAFDDLEQERTTFNGGFGEDARREVPLTTPSHVSLTQCLSFRF